MQVISVASQKGGVGKTTTAISLSSGLALQGKKVLLVDMDSQANASKVLKVDYAKHKPDETVHRTILGRKPLPIQTTEVDNLSVVLSHILLAESDIELTTAKDHREARLKRELDNVKDHYDYVFIDCPPALSWLTINAFTASDKVLIPVSPGFFELGSLSQIQKSIQEVKEFYNPDLAMLGILFTMKDPTKNAQHSLQLLRQAYPDDVIGTVIPRNTDIRDAYFNNQDIFSFNPQAKGALAYKRLIDELFV